MVGQWKRIVFISLALLILATGLTWAAGTLTGAGATFPYPIYSKWFDTYGNITGVKINYGSIGSGGGIQQLKAGTVDFGASDAPLSNEEMASMPSEVVHIPTVAGAVVLTYNVEGAGRELRLTGDVIAGIFLGKIRRWNDPAIRMYNPGLRLPSQAIYVAHRSDGSGTSYIFTHYLSSVSSEWKDSVGAGKSVQWPTGIGGKGNEGVAEIVKETPGAIGYVELAYAVQNGMPCADVRNRVGQFITPNLESTTKAANGGAAAMRSDIRTLIVNSPARGAYPISGFTYILLYKNQSDWSTAHELVRFLNWAMHDGQKLTKKLWYAKLPSSVVALNMAALKSIQAGGKPAL